MVPAATFNVGLIQMRVAPDRATNLARAGEHIRRAAADGAEIIVLPELHNGPYFCQKEDATLFDLAEAIPGPSTDYFAALAQETGTVIVASLFERRMPGVYHNTAAVFDTDGAFLGIYRKMHIPDDPLYYEKYYFTPGDLGFKVFNTKKGKVGTLVCWDQWYPEAARLTALQGAEILVYPTAIGWHPHEKAEWGAAQHAAWETSMRGHAIANGIWVAAVNRVGHEGPSDGGLEFWGASFVADPIGRIVQRAGHDQEAILLQTCNRRLLEEVRRNWPFFRDRRIDFYAGITRRVAD